MEKELARAFAALMESYLDIPSMVCEMIETKLIQGKYEEVVKYVLARRLEVEKERKS